MSLPRSLKKRACFSNTFLMKTKIQLFAVVAVASITSGCVLPAPYYDSPVEYGAPVPYNEIIVPEVVIVEHGVRHDRYFYQRHPEFYHRDRMRYPERFHHMPPPPPRYVHSEYRSHAAPVPKFAPGRPDDRHDDKRHDDKKHEDSKSKKKKHHDDDHH